MVQLGEAFAPGSLAASEGYDTIAAVGRERVRRAGNALAKSGFSGDLGFRALRLDSPTRTDVWVSPDSTSQAQLLGLERTIKADRSDEDLLFDTLIDLGLDPGLSISRVSSSSATIFNVANGALLACFSEPLTVAVLTEIARQEPLQAVFRASAFQSDAQRINAEQLFEQLSPNTTLATV